MAQQFYDRYNRHSDGVHQTAFNSDSGQREGITEFDYDEMDRNLSGERGDLDEPGYSISGLGSAVHVILEWLASAQSLEYMAGRVLALHFYLRPENSGFKSISEIALAVGCTKQAISKSLLEFRDSIGFNLVAGKMDGSPEAYAKAQNAAVRAGVHAAFVRKDIKHRRAKSDAEQTADANRRVNAKRCQSIKDDPRCARTVLGFS